MSPQIVVALQYGVVVGVILYLGSKIKPSHPTHPKTRPYYRHHTYSGKKKG